MANISKAEDWNAEYGRKGIPSSFRNDPSGSLITFLEALSARGFSGKKAIDVGCGTGRNALALAQAGFEVMAMDFASDVVDRFAQEVQLLSKAKDIHVRCHDVTSPWPIADAWADVAIDTFCFKHQIPMQHRMTYVSELRRVVRTSGAYLLTLADVSDGYYSKYFKDELGKNVVVDPENGIPSVLYTKDDVIEIFQGFKLLAYHEKKNESVMHGETHKRFTHLFIFEREK